MNTDYWKRRVHEGFMADPKPPDGEPRGSITLWGEEPREHRNAESGDFAHQIVAEVWRKQPFKEGKGAPEGWHKAHRDNHYLDCVAGAACAAAVAGFRPIVTPKKKRARVKLSELQQKKRGKPRASSVRRSKPRVVE